MLPVASGEPRQGSSSVRTIVEHEHVSIVEFAQPSAGGLECPERRFRMMLRAGPVSAFVRRRSAVVVRWDLHYFMEVLMHNNKQPGFTVEVVTVHRKIDEAELAAAAFLARHSGRTLRGVPSRSSQLLRMGGISRPRNLDRDPAPQRTVPSSHGRLRPGCVNDRPPPCDRVRPVPVRAHRRTNHREPSPIRPPTQSSSHPRPRTRPHRTRTVLVHLRTRRPSTRCLGGPARFERVTGQ